MPTNPASKLARIRWSRTTDPDARTAATSAARNARWASCRHCGHGKLDAIHDVSPAGTDPARHAFVPTKKKS